MANYLTTDTDLTAVADAIRTKGGTSASLVFPAGFVDAIDAIETGGGGGYALDDIADFSEPHGAIRLNVIPHEYAFYGRPNITSVYARGFQVATAGWNYVFQNCSGITKAVVGTIGNNYGTSMFRSCSNLEVLDYEGVRFRSQALLSCTKLTAIILRNIDGICGLENTGLFIGTPFASGGSGGTIYIPQSLYSHLGDGTSLDYKSATNWSTIDGYGTITWAQIEGSQYGNYYADGTPIT